MTVSLPWRFVTIWTAVAPDAVGTFLNRRLMYLFYGPIYIPEPGGDGEVTSINASRTRKIAPDCASQIITSPPTTWPCSRSYG